MKVITVACAAFVTGAIAAPAPDAVTRFPIKPIRLVASGAGGAGDFAGRLIAAELTQRLGQQVVVDNRPGAGSIVGTEAVARAPADGYTLLMTSATFSFNPGLYQKLSYDSFKDFTGVSLVTTVPHVIVVLPSLPARSLPAFVKLAQARPGQVLYASAGAGTAIHLAAARFAMVTKTDMVQVPYKGGGAAVAAVLSGEVTTLFATIESVLPLVRAEKLRALAVSTRERAAALPDVPTAMEAGVKDYEAQGWFGMLAPAGTPVAIIDRLSGEIARTMKEARTRDRFTESGATPVASTPAEFNRFLADEIPKWTRIIREAGIKLE